MSIGWPRAIGLAAALAVTGSGVAAQDAADLGAALASGDADIGVRYRYEHVDQDGFAEDASASTARLRLSYRTGLWQGAQGFLEFDHVFHVLARDFDSGAGTSPGRERYPVVADPKGPDLNQLYVDFAAGDKWSVRVGRQRILLDNHRFVGNVGWRQNEQTYDAVKLATGAFQNTNLIYAYVNTVRRIFGDDVLAGRNQAHIHLLNAEISLTGEWSLTPYFYYIDNSDVPEFSTATIGARVRGKPAVGGVKLELLAEFATQSDAANAPVSYDAEYLHLKADLALSAELALSLGFESLGGDARPGRMFRTPLATLHAFQGWADQFLTTPAGGIDDVYAGLSYAFDVWKLNATYHDFSAETGGGDYGSEIDFSVGRKLGKRHALLFKGALFEADSAPYSDTAKLWIMLTANF